MSYRFLLAFALGFPVLGLAQQSINGGFEELQPNGLPMGWSMADGGGASTTKDAHLGNVAAKVWIQRYYDPGQWNGKLSVEQGNASQVTGYYKYVGDKAECDKAVVSYLMGARSEAGTIDTIAYSMTELKLSKEYRRFDLSVSGGGRGIPDFVNIQFMPQGRCNEHGESNCCFLFVDDVVLGGSAGIRQPEPEPVKEQPMDEEGNEAVKTPVGENKGMTPEETQPEENTEPAEEEAQPAEKENTEVQPEEGSGDAETQPAEEQPVEEVVPAEEEGTAPVDEEWDSEEESSDGGR